MNTRFRVAIETEIIETDLGLIHHHDGIRKVFEFGNLKEAKEAYEKLEEYVLEEFNSARGATHE